MNAINGKPNRMGYKTIDLHKIQIVQSIANIENCHDFMHNFIHRIQP
jgi:hypothetical protein